MFPLQEIRFVLQEAKIFICSRFIDFQEGCRNSSEHQVAIIRPPVANGDVCIVADVSSRQGCCSPLSPEESAREPPDSPGRIQQELTHLRTELEGDRELLRQRTGLLVQQHLAVAQCAREQLEL